MKAIESIEKINLTDSIEDEAFWKRHVELYKTSQLTRAEYCRLNQVNYDRFGYWLSKWTPKSSSLVAVKLKSITKEVVSISRHPLCALSLRGGRHRLEIYDQKVLSVILEKLS